MDIFTETLKNSYLVKKTECSHENKNHAVFIQRPEEEDEESEWDRYISCEKCCNRFIECVWCSGAYINFKLYVDGIDVSNKYNIQSFPFVQPNIMKFYHYDGDEWNPIIYRFVLREKDFSSNYYELYFYNKLKEMYDIELKEKKNNIGQITKALEGIPNKKSKLWNVKIINDNKFNNINEYVELVELDLKKFDYFN